MLDVPEALFCKSVCRFCRKEARLLLLVVELELAVVLELPSADCRLLKACCNAVSAELLEVLPDDSCEIRFCSPVLAWLLPVLLPLLDDED